MEIMYDGCLPFIPQCALEQDQAALSEALARLDIRVPFDRALRLDGMVTTTLSKT